MEPILYRFYHELLAALGPQHWWPADSPWEVAVGAVLVQNTNWRNVERAIARLVDAGALDPEAIARMEPEALAELIRPSGTHRVKARRLAAVAGWWLEHAASAQSGSAPLGALRPSLLATHGVGPETADSILLYAFGLPVFVVDAYTRRWLQRHGLAQPGASYACVQRMFMEQLPPDPVIYNEYHALIVELGKRWCRPSPACGGCVLRWHLPEPPATG